MEKNGSAKPVKAQRSHRISGWIGLITFSTLFGLLLIGALIAGYKLGGKFLGYFW